MNMVLYNQEVFDTYAHGDTFKVKLRCGGIVNARASGMFIYLN